MAKIEKFQNSEGLTEGYLLEELKKSLTSIQKDLAERNTVDEAKNELKRINGLFKQVKLEQRDNQGIWKISEMLTGLEGTVDKNVLKDEVNEVVKFLERLTQKDLASLKKTLQQTNFEVASGRSIEARIWIDVASNNLNKVIGEASQDKNPIARKMGEWMENLMA